MEEKLDSIDEKLCELKNTVESPDCSALFAGFKWTREWFKSAEDTLLALAFRGETDQQVLEFIWQKIIDTDIITFNKILRSFSAAPIRNHYELLIEKKCFEILLEYCENERVMDTIIKEHIHLPELSKLPKSTLSACKHDKIVKYLIDNPKKIDWHEFANNNNPEAVKFCLKNNKKSKWSLTDDDQKRTLFCHTCNDLHIYPFTVSSHANDVGMRILLENPENIDYSGLSENPNDLAVDHLLANPNRIDWEHFCQNSNGRAVDYLLQNPSKINWWVMYSNTNNRAAEYYIANANGNSLHMASANPNDKIVDYLLSHPDEINWCAFMENTNDRVIDFILKNKLYNNNLKFMSSNRCNYNVSKLREFNKLRLFPRINGLVI